MYLQKSSKCSILKTLYLKISQYTVLPNHMVYTINGALTVVTTLDTSIPLGGWVTNHVIIS